MAALKNKVREVESLAYSQGHDMKREVNRISMIQGQLEGAQDILQAVSKDTRNCLSKLGLQAAKVNFGTEKEKTIAAAAKPDATQPTPIKPEPTAAGKKEPAVTAEASAVKNFRSKENVSIWDPDYEKIKNSPADEPSVTASLKKTFDPAAAEFDPRSSRGTTSGLGLRGTSSSPGAKQDDKPGSRDTNGGESSGKQDDKQMGSQKSPSVSSGPPPKPMSKKEQLAESQTKATQEETKGESWASEVETEGEKSKPTDSSKGGTSQRK